MYGGCYVKNTNGRIRDHILTNFKCDLCHFRNIKGQYLTEGRDKDERLIISNRRASLDAFWSIEPGTCRKKPVRYEYTFTASKNVENTRYVSAFLGSVVIGVVICVDIYIFLVGFKFPCTITTDFGKYFYTILGANLGND